MTGAEVDAALLALVNQTVRPVHAEYADYVERDDLKQELAVYALQMRDKFGKWLADDEQRVVLALRGAAKVYCETERAHRLGYEYDDVAWYSPAGLASLVPIALDESWDGLTGEGAEDEQPQRGPVGEGGTLLAMVADIRRVFHRGGYRRGGFDIETERGMENLEWLSEALGGDYPSAPGYRRGRRRVVSNAEAQREVAA